MNSLELRVNLFNPCSSSLTIFLSLNTHDISSLRNPTKSNYNSVFNDFFEKQSNFSKQAGFFKKIHRLIFMPISGLLPLDFKYWTTFSLLKILLSLGELLNHPILMSRILVMVQTRTALQIVHTIPISI